MTAGRGGGWDEHDQTVDAVLFKHEGEVKGRIVGPVWVRQGGVTRNLRDSPTAKHGGGRFPAWLTLEEARQAAGRLGLPLLEL